MQRRIIVFISFCFAFHLMIGQERFSISGQVLNVDHEVVENAAIGFSDNRGVLSDSRGRFKLVVSQHEVRLTVSHARYVPQVFYLSLTKDTTLTVVLLEDVKEIEEVEVEADKRDFVQNVIPGMVSIRQEDLSAQPQLLGVPDVISAIQRGAGVQTVTEGVAGIYVRGGDAGQNLIIYDNIELVDPTHLLGTYSVFNPYLVERADLYKGNAPVEYSGKLSSSIVVSSYDNCDQLPTITANLGTLASSVAFAWQKGRWGVMGGARRTQIEMYKLVAQEIAPQLDGFLKNNNYSFNDINGKVFYHPGDEDQLSLSWYMGGDNLMYNKQEAFEVGTDWYNKGLALNWKHTGTDWAINTTAGANTYGFHFDGDIMSYIADFNTEYQSIYFKHTYKKLWEKHLLTLNFNAHYYHVTPQSGQVSDQINQYEVFDMFKSGELAVSIADKWQINEQLSMYYGVNLNQFWQFGPHAYKDINGSDTTTMEYDADEVVASHFTLSPLFYLTWERPHNLSYKWAYSYNTQNIHRGSLATLPLPADIWISSSKLIKPELAHQMTFGAYKSINGYDFSAEVYGRKMANILLFEANLTGELKANFEDNFTSGEGYAVGLELLARKNTGPLSGWVSYTLSKSRKRIDGINDGQWFDAKYDRVHDLSIVGNFEANKRWDFSLAFVLASGNKSTVPAGRYLMMGYIMNDYTTINGFRMPVYHRLDLSVNYHLKPRFFKASTLNFSVINVYNRKNTYFFFYEVRGDLDNYNISVEPHQFSLFPVLPSLSWTFKF